MGVARKEDRAGAARRAAVGRRKARARQLSTNRRARSLLEMPHIFVVVFLYKLCVFVCG